MSKAEFDAVGASYHAQIDDSIAFCPLERAFFIASKADLLESILAGAKAKMLDVGCGPGTLSRLLAERGHTVTGVDPSTEMLQEAHKNCPSGTFVAMQDETLPFPDAQFDCVFAVCVFHHIREDARRDTLAREMRRVCKPGGIVAIVEHNPLNPATRLSVIRCAFDRDARLLHRGDARAVLARASCARIAHRFFLFLPWRSTFTRLFERRLSWLPLGAQYCVYGHRE